MFGYVRVCWDIVEYVWVYLGVYSGMLGYVWVRLGKYCIMLHLHYVCIYYHPMFQAGMDGTLKEMGESDGQACTYIVNVTDEDRVAQVSL